MTNSFIKITNLQKIEKKFQALILDIWGVLWDGIKPYSNAIESLKKLKAKNKPVILLSNAPRRINLVKKKLREIGIHDKLYEQIISSGEMCRNNFLNNKSIIAEIGKCFYFIGQDEDKSITKGLQIEEVDDMEHADFLLVCGTRDFDDNLNVYKNEMKKALEFEIPFVCANPDKVVIRQNGKLLICAGKMAEYYKNNGGKIYSFGKPYRSAYEACIKHLEKLKPNIKKQEILIVGDSLETDILGANNFNISSLLIAGGIHSKELLNGEKYVSNDQIKKIFSDNSSYPNFIMKQFIF